MTDLKNVKRVLIIGSGGAGKTTLALQLGKISALPVVHLDRRFWNGSWTHLTDAEFDSVLQNELEKEKWIIDGNYIRTLERRLSYCDFAIYLDYSPIVCVFGVIKRVLKHHGKTRPDMGGYCPERFDLSFFKWVYSFRRKHRSELVSMLTASGKEHVILRSRKDCRLFLDAFLSSVS